MNRALALLILLLVAAGSADAAGDDVAAEAQPAASASIVDTLVTPVRDYVARALTYVMPPVERGIGAVAAIIGDAYDYAHGVTQDYAWPAPWYRLAAADDVAGDATSAESGGLIDTVMTPIRDNFSLAFGFVMPRVRGGIGAVEGVIGDAYYYGHWVTRDYAQAARWYRRAAADGNALAQSTLGDMYYYGRDVPQDFAAAATWWQVAADRGVAIAQLNLSVMYANGDGVERDYIKSHMYANLAAALLPPGEDHEIASKNRDIIARTLTPAELAEAQRLAREWRPLVRH